MAFGTFLGDELGSRGCVVLPSMRDTPCKEFVGIDVCLVRYDSGSEELEQRLFGHLHPFLVCRFETFRVRSGCFGKCPFGLGVPADADVHLPRR